MADQLEHWLPVTGWSDLYEVSSHGRVRSRDRISTYVRRDGLEVTRQLRGKILRQSYHQKRGGYQSCISNIRAGRRWAHAGGLR